ncbi:MAG: F0F1 ATP synthase subunit gamma [Chloroflexi bacterium AL-W]|nr:F0F1 ATP synthase subunit gamma [Chloroflexi bacterium AL-N1]NOK64971.1 F0F1 ATP synthase subunit gamma [Chloroflexi bacterium AL-N10]NOK76741.1 F0F1 ATP synthase subunit gamma [Chloroflexi bacterium AL-N5]NOK84632.1 F0F1 ATP synthase subunit gamma [Chloroflexi bacterium AL-W]NOK86543.1 F0F1 ATP synthase subunit gamma [Chloroflexi bacterium AL-N15]
MPSTREIRRRIKSVKNLSQITRAMEMVSASRMRRAQRNVLATRPYADRLLDVMSELMARSSGGRRGSLLEVRPDVKSVGLIVITPDRGLAGSLVANVLRRVTRTIADEQQQGRNVELLTIGKKGRDFMMRNGFSVIAEITKIGDYPRLVDTLGISTNVINGFREQRYDEVYVIYSEFVNTLVQRPTLKRLLPVEPPGEVASSRFDYTYEPSQEEVLDGLLPRFVEVQLYQAVLEAIASEHSARMVAMRNATDNAKELNRDLTLTFNKTRQTSITNEVSEIAAGAAAQGS